jgi:hypothetical protein
VTGSAAFTTATIFALVGALIRGVSGSPRALPGLGYRTIAITTTTAAVATAAVATAIASTIVSGFATTASAVAFDPRRNLDLAEPEKLHDPAFGFLDHFIPDLVLIDAEGDSGFYDGKVKSLARGRYSLF